MLRAASCVGAARSAFSTATSRTRRAAWLSTRPRQSRSSARRWRL